MTTKQSDNDFLKAIYYFGRIANAINQIIANQEKELEIIMDNIHELLSDEYNRDYDKIFKSLMANLFYNISDGKENKIILIPNIKDDEHEYIENFEEVCKQVAEDYQFKVSFLKEENGPNCIAQFISEFEINEEEI